MDLESVKEKVYDITEMFFKGATIFWTEQGNTKPEPPYVTLKVGDVKRNLFPAEEDGRKVYQCSTRLEVNLYTLGKKIVWDRENTTANYINTATSDMMNFCNYLDSEYVTDFFYAYDMGILFLSPVRDLTELQPNKRNYRYRSMAEFEVSFIEEADGMYGVLGVELPNYSGGGTEEMAAREIEPIESVEIQYNKEVEDGI